MFMNTCSDYHNSSGIVWLSFTNLILTWNHIKINPCSVHTFNHTFGTKNIVRRCKLLQNIFQLTLFKFVWSFFSPASKYISCMMMVMTMFSTSTFFIMMVFMFSKVSN